MICIKKFHLISFKKKIVRIMYLLNEAPHPSKKK